MYDNNTCHIHTTLHKIIHQKHLDIQKEVIIEKRRQTSDGAVFFSCNDCETKASKYLSAVAKIKEDGSYELIEWPRSKDHSCWVDGNQALIKKARNEMFLKIDQDPSRSINQIYEEVRNSTTQTMTSQDQGTKFLMTEEELYCSPQMST